MAIGNPVVFATQNSGATTTTGQLTVPAGVSASDVIVICCEFITGTALTATTSTSGSGVLTQRFSGALATSAWLFVFTGTGFVTGDTITVTPNILNRVVSTGLAYANAAYEKTGTGGATSTTVSTAPSTSADNATDRAIAINAGIASASGRTYSGLTATWTSRTFIQGGSTTRFQQLQMSDKLLSASGLDGDVVATSSGAMLGSTGVQIILSEVVAGSGTASKVKVAGSIVTAVQKAKVAGSIVTATQKVRVAGTLV